MIWINLQNKSLVVAVDLIASIVNYFRKPFSGEEVVDYTESMQHLFNNYPPMRIRIAVKDFALILAENFTNINSDSAIMICNVNYSHEWLGDANEGPGSVQMGADVGIRRMIMTKTNKLFDGKEDNKLKGEDPVIGIFSLIEPFMIVYKTLYKCDVYKRHHKVIPTYDLSLEIKNSSKSNNTLIFSMDHLHTFLNVVNNIMAPSITRIKKKESNQQNQQIQQVEKEEILSNYIIIIHKLKITTIKIIHGIELAKFCISGLLLKMHQVINL